MKPADKLKQLMAKLVELPPTDDKLDLAIDFCSNGEFPTAQSVSNAIIADIQSASSPTRFLWDSCNIDLENDDVGSIVGYDASGGPVLDKYDIVPEGDVSELVVPPSTEVINGLTVTYPPYNSLNPSGQFIMKCMSKWWLKGAFDLVEQAYGLKFDSNSFVTTMPIQLDDIPPSGGAIVMAYVMSSYNTATFKTVSMYCAVNTNSAAYGDMDLTNPNGQANSYAGSNMFLDRVLCHELVHGVMSANISGFNAKLPKYFTEGTAELIAGADDTRKSELLATASSVAMFQAGLDNNATDTLRWYTTGYIWLRWYIKHTSKKGVDLSFEHPLPDLEIFEYKVSDGVAFEYGRANNERFDLIGDEAIDFYTRNHTGLNKWDLCTSPEYLNSAYGATVRIPFDDAKDGEDLDYTDVITLSPSTTGTIIYTDAFMSQDGVFPNRFWFAKAIPKRDSTLYSFLHDTAVHGILDILYESYMNVDFIVDPSSLFSGAITGNIHILLLGDFSLSDFCGFINSSDRVAAANAFVNYVNSQNGDIICMFDDLRTFSLNDVDTIDQTTYENNLLSVNDTTLMSIFNNCNYIIYVDYRRFLLSKYPYVTDFISHNIINSSDYSSALSLTYPAISRYFFNSYFADFIANTVLVDALSSPTISDSSIPIIAMVFTDFHATYSISYMQSVYPNMDANAKIISAEAGSWQQVGHYVTLDEFYDGVISHLYDSNDNFIIPLSNKYIVFSGLEILCIFGYSVYDAYQLLLRFRQFFVSRGYRFAYSFLPTVIYSDELRLYYSNLKILVESANEVQIDVDAYRCFTSLAGFLLYWRICDPGRGCYLNLSNWAEYLNQRQGDNSWVGISAHPTQYPIGTINPIVTVLSKDQHINNTKSPCYYTSFTQLPFTDRQDKLRAIDGATQAYDGVSADILDVNLHTVYDPLSPSYYQGGGTCKQVYDYEKDSTTGKLMLGLINGHAEGENTPNVDNNISYPVYGSGCPWIVYTEKEKSSYDSVYFYFTRDAYSGTITYQLTSSKYPSLKPIFQTIVFGSPDTDNYTSKYPLYVGGGANYVAHTEYSYTYMPPGKNAKPVTVHVEGNKYDLNLMGTKTSNISPIYPVAESDSEVTNFVFRGSDGEWKYLAAFDGSISTDEILFAHKLADPYYWGVISPYVGSDIDYSYIYDINTDTTNIYKPVRIINPYRELKEERGFGAISLSNLYAKCSDNRFGIRKVKTKEYVYSRILSKVENNTIFLTDDFDKFDKLDVIFADGNNQYTATWHRNSLTRALLNSSDIDFDLTRGIVYNLSWNVNISVSAKNIFYGLSNNCNIIDIVGYKERHSRYLVLPNSCVHKEFGMKDATGEISTYGLNNVLCIYLGEG